MRKLGLLALLALLGGGVALAKGIVLDQSDVKSLTDCAANGSTPVAVSLTANYDYVMTVTGEDTTVCLSATCSSGGSLFPNNTVIRISIGNATQSVTCRSAGATGDVQFTRAN
jgi:hypothetical protein